MLHHGAHMVGMEKPSMKKKGGDALTGDALEWQKTIYFKEDIGVYLPPENIEAALVNASKQFKITGRKTAMDYVKSGVFCTESYLPFYVNGKTIKTLDDPAILIDKRTVKNPATKGRNVRYRAKFTEWTSTFRLNVLCDDYITKELLEQILEYAGMYVGLGDYRPRFGRFTIESVKEVKNA